MDDETRFACHICLESVLDPVVTLCGHLFCWPCIYLWSFKRRPRATLCPVCNSPCPETAIIPLYVVGKLKIPTPELSSDESELASSGASTEVPRRPQRPPVLEPGLPPLRQPAPARATVSFTPPLGSPPALFELQFQPATPLWYPPANKQLHTRILSLVLAFGSCCVLALLVLC